MSWQILQGDALEMLKTLGSESVHCCVTSPPYWGLRDYGTARWDGGLADCDHMAPVSLRRDSPGGFHNSTSRGTQPATVAVAKQYAEHCRKCGAIRKDGQIGLEKTPELYVSRMVEVFREVRRVLRKDGSLWLNIGDSYSSGGHGGGGSFMEMRGGNGSLEEGAWSHRKDAKGWRNPPPGLKPKDLVGIPWMLAFALRADGWYLRQDIIWAKTNPMPESVIDRCTKAHEYLFLLSKRARYYFDAEGIKELCETGDRGSSFTDERDLARHPNTGNGMRKIKVPGGWDRGEGAHGTIHRNGRTSAEYQEAEVSPYRNKRSVWEIATAPFPEAHFATFPPKLIEPCILAGTSEQGCCAKCGAPRERIVERGELQAQPGYENTTRTFAKGQNCDDSQYRGANFIKDGFQPNRRYENKTLGWQPSCKCGVETKPCTVLDPFSGAATTGLVATRFQRNFIGIELNPEYVKMSEKRIIEDAPLFNSGANAVCTEEDRR